MLFKRDGAHGLDAPLLLDTPEAGISRKTPMLKANGGDFPSDPEALPNALAMSPSGTILPMSLVGTCRPAAEARLGHF
jgi:hypothetical protein